MEKDNLIVNDIGQCIALAKLIKSQVQDSHKKDLRPYQAFISLSGDEKTGLLAYTIWRSRTCLL